MNLFSKNQYCTIHYVEDHSSNNDHSNNGRSDSNDQLSNYNDHSCSKDRSDNNNDHFNNDQDHERRFYTNTEHIQSENNNINDQW